MIEGFLEKLVCFRLSGFCGKKSSRFHKHSRFTRGLSHVFSKDTKILHKITLRDPENFHPFLSFKCHTKKIHPNTISSWLKQSIKLRYELSGKPLPSKVVGHSVRSLAVSWASLRMLVCIKFLIHATGKVQIPLLPST